MIGSTAAWRFSGFSWTRVLPMLPQPVNIASPSGMVLGYGNETVETKGFNWNGRSTSINAMSYGPTLLKLKRINQYLFQFDVFITEYDLIFYLFYFTRYGKHYNSFRYILHIFLRAFHSRNSPVVPRMDEHSVHQSALLRFFENIQFVFPGENVKLSHRRCQSFAVPGGQNPSSCY